MGENYKAQNALHALRRRSVYFEDVRNIFPDIFPSLLINKINQLQSVDSYLNKLRKSI